MMGGPTRRLSVTYSQEISWPVGDDRQRNLMGWMGGECRDCGDRRRGSHLGAIIDQVDWVGIVTGELPNSVVSVTSIN